MVFNRIFILAFFFIETQMCSSIEVDTMNNVTTVFVDGQKGSNIPSCGQQNSPCRTVGFAVERVMEGNSTFGVINLFPGAYKTESVKIDCSTGFLEELILQGLENDTNEKVQVALSADVIKCKIIFNNIQWTSNPPSPVLLNLVIASLSLINSSVIGLPFSIIAMGSNIKLQLTSITSCIGLQPLLPLVLASGIPGFETEISINMSTFSLNNARLISVKEISAFHMEKSNFISNNATMGQELIFIDRTSTVIGDSHFLNNSGTLIKMVLSTMANITSSLFKNNAVMSGSLIDAGKQVVLHVVGCSFSSNYGNSNGPVLKAEQETSVVDIQSSYFSCNKVNSSIHLPPIHSHSLNHHINCTNCSVNPHCPVYCPVGSFLLDSTMCSPCPNGSYSPGRVHNITTITCKKCSPGYYSSTSGSHTCKPCKKGTYAAISGASKCSPCKNDFMTSGEGESSCSKMTIGCIVLTVFVILLILIPLLILAWEHLYKTTNKIYLSTKQTDFTRLCEHSQGSIQ